MKSSYIGYCVIILFFFIAFPAFSMVPVRQSDLSEVTGIAPGFFGPNAFPIPEMSNGTVPSDISVDIAGSFYRGFLCPGAIDNTFDSYLNLSIPLYRNRIGLYIWMVPREWYCMEESVMDARRIENNDGSKSVTGDVTVTLEILLLKETELLPSMTVRSVLKSASGDEYEMARYYDCPGYYFDITAAKSVYTSSNFLRDFRIGASTGFLCWQTDVGRQNDAVQYGVFFNANTRYLELFTQFSGYSGWEKYGDCPISLTSRISACPDWTVSPFFQFQHGFRDWPFDQYRIGVKVDVSKALKARSTRENY